MSWLDKYFILSTIAPGGPGQALFTNAAGNATPWVSLSGDAANSITAPGKLTVTGLQGRAVAISAPADGNVLTWVSGNSDWEPKAVISGGWVTALDLDFTAQANQTFASDGAVSFAGLMWQKVNSANDLVAPSNTNGVGLNFQPNNVANYPGGTNGSGPGTRTLPLLWLPLSSIISTAIDWNTGIRIWLYNSVDNIDGVNKGAAAFGCDDNGASINNGYIMLRGQNNPQWANNSAGVWSVWSSSNNWNTNRHVSANMTLDSSNKVMVLEIPSLGGFFCRGSLASNASIWPASSALNIATEQGGLPFSDTTGPILEHANSMGVFLGAKTQGGFTGLSVTYARLRVDYKVN